MKRLLFFLIIILIHSCKKEESKTTYLGVVDLTVNGHADAIPQFEKGLLLLHSFEYRIIIVYGVSKIMRTDLQL